MTTFISFNFRNAIPGAAVAMILEKNCFGYVSSRLLHYFVEFEPGNTFKHNIGRKLTAYHSKSAFVLSYLFHRTWVTPWHRLHQNEAF